MKSISLKGLITIALAGFMALQAQAQTGEILVNSDVVRLTNLGLTPATIISKIEATNSNFNVSIDSLEALQRMGVNKDVINEMVAVTTQQPAGSQNQSGQNPGGQNGEQYQGGQGNNQNAGGQSGEQYQSMQGNSQYAGGQAPPPSPPPPAYSSAGKDMNDPATWRQEGIYYYNKANPAGAITPINGDPINGMKTGGYGTRVAQYYSMGFAKNKQEAVVDGTHSYRQLHDDMPVFYFYFNSDRMSPGQFVLVNMIQKHDSRVIIVGSSNYYERDRGIDDRERVDFTIEKVAGGVYKVHPMGPLKPGEYCFMYTGPGHTAFSDMVYDFGVMP